VHDGVGPVHDGCEVVHRDVGFDPVHLRREPGRPAPGDPDDDVHGRIVAEE
jgi:hypothetical protein